MQVISTIPAFRAARQALPGSLGLVPTMGYLHAGHITLVRRAKAACEHVAVSIFVNPTQFGPHEDLARYPRNLPRDLALLEAEGVDLVFTPEAAEMYPPQHSTFVDVEGVTAPLEGAHRPGHFRGVATVVCMLFNIVGAEQAFFGQKDAQQVVVIRRMTADLHIPTTVVVVPTVREADGLAMSSRNVYLSSPQRAAAPVLYRALSQAAALYEQGERSAARLRAIATSLIEREPLVQLEYLSVADPETLAEIEDEARGGVLISLAARLGTTRLIDNVIVGNEKRGRSG